MRILSWLLNYDRSIDALRQRAAGRLDNTPLNISYSVRSQCNRQADWRRHRMIRLWVLSFAAYEPDGGADFAVPAVGAAGAAAGFFFAAASASLASTSAASIG